VLLLGAQVADVVIDFGERGAILVNLLVRGLTLAEDAEGAIIAIAHGSRAIICLVPLAIYSAVRHLFCATVITLTVSVCVCISWN